MDFRELKLSDRQKLLKLSKARLADELIRFSIMNQNASDRITKECREVATLRQELSVSRENLEHAERQIVSLKQEVARKQGYIDRVYEQEERKDFCSMDNRRRNDPRPTRLHQQDHIDTGRTLTPRNADYPF